MKPLLIFAYLAGFSLLPATCSRPDSKSFPLCRSTYEGWCPALPGDPCAVHENTSSCQKDPRCQGLGYRGESFVPCQRGDRNFASNCPNVSCVSLCERLDERLCRAY